MRGWVLALCLLLTAGCGRPPVVVAGSSCMGRMMAALAEGYAGTAGGQVEVQLGGTELGLLSLREGGCDLASCSREPRPSDGVEAYPLAVDAIAVVVHPSNPVPGLTLEALRAIYAGRITDWSELGGPALPIVVIGREAGSGTRTAFERGIGLEGAARHAQEHNETGILRTAVSLCPGAIGYLSFDYAGEGSGVRMLPVEGVLPGEETVSRGLYPLTRRFYLCCRPGEEAEPARRFIAFCRGETGMRIIRSLGIIAKGGEAVCGETGSGG